MAIDVACPGTLMSIITCGYLRKRSAVGKVGLRTARAGVDSQCRFVELELILWICCCSHLREVVFNG
jgi:hypothetical protein